MKQLIGLVRSGAQAALSVARCGAHQQTETTDNSCGKKRDRQGEPKRELVLLGFEGTVFAREISLVAPQRARLGGW